MSAVEQNQSGASLVGSEASISAVGSSVHSGSVHSGSVHSGSVHSGSVHSGSVHAGPRAEQEPSFLFSLAPEALASGIQFKAPRNGDAGFDLPVLEAAVIPPGEFRAVRTGVHLAIPTGYVGLVRDRSSVALRGGACTAGVIDASYRGEVKVVIHNLSKTELSFQTGDRIAQILIMPHLQGLSLQQVQSVEGLGLSERGAGGFGSTGR